jgi:hypothetical protein
MFRCHLGLGAPPVDTNVLLRRGGLQTGEYLDAQLFNLIVAVGAYGFEVHRVESERYQRRQPVDDFVGRSGDHSRT